jgi:methyl-accepting chemotaxis protein
MIAMFDDWRLSAKMMLAFVVIGLMVSAMGVTAIVSNKTLTAIAADHVDRGFVGTEALGRLMSSLREDRIIIFSRLNAASPAEVEELETRSRKNSQALQQALDDFTPLAGELEPRVDSIKATVNQLDGVHQRIFNDSQAAEAQAVLPLVMGEGRDLSKRAIAQVEDLISRFNARAKTANEAGEATARKALYFTFGLLGLSLAALMVMWKLTAMTVSDPLAGISTVTTLLAAGGNAEVPHRMRKDELGDVARAVEQFREAAVARADADALAAAEQQTVTSSLRGGLAALTAGDLTTDINVEFPPAYAELKINFNEALAALRELIGSVSQSAASISTGSGEIALASEDLARRTEGNAASLEETSASLVQIDDRIRGSAVAAARTVERADQAITTVGGGRAIADEAVLAMGRVSDSAKGIDSVIEGLDKIAFQTRVLAMNAAVEAGRAGDAGRGFAVVADLVSALAMRAEEEAKRARSQLTVTQTDIITAVDAVRRVDGALADISGDVREVHELLATMALDNQAQSVAVTQISSAIGTMDKATQQNAAMVEQTSAAARNLANEVSALTQQAARFRTDRYSDQPATKLQGGTPIPVPAAPLRKSYAIAPVDSLAPAMADGHDDWNEF